DVSRLRRPRVLDLGPVHLAAPSQLVQPLQSFHAHLLRAWLRTAARMSYPLGAPAALPRYDASITASCLRPARAGRQGLARQPDPGARHTQTAQTAANADMWLAAAVAVHAIRASWPPRERSHRCGRCSNAAQRHQDVSACGRLAARVSAFATRDATVFLTSLGGA